MKSINENARRVLSKVKDQLTSAFVRLRSTKLPLSELKVSLIGQKQKKVKALKQKYSNSRSTGSDHNNKKTPVSPYVRNYLLKLKAQGRHAQEVLVSRLRFSAWLKISSKFSSFPGSRFLNIKTVAAAVMVFSLGGVLLFANSKIDAFALEIDGKQIAAFTDKAGAERVISELKNEKAKTWNRKVDITQSIAIKDTKAKRMAIAELPELKDKLNNTLTFVAVATGIKADGQVAVVVKDEGAANSILQQLKDSYSSQEFSIENISFQEKIELVDVPVSLNEVVEQEEALELIREGKEKKRVHVVKEGDSLWLIARANDMRVEDLQQANPALKGERLSIGQELNLVALEPLINVKATGQITAKETLPYKVVVQTDKTLWRGTEKVKVKGENGLREVTYNVVLKNGTVVDREVKDEKILKPAVNKVVTRGSKIVVASRSGGGLLGWPIKGRITSNYGKRWREFHTGLDIDGTTGQPVGAAASGKVVSTGWGGGYGRMVEIKHDNGLVTRYAHLSKISVSEGQKVERGDLIGLVGSSGRSTGSHLHFEVMSNGSFQNPMKFLK